MRETDLILAANPDRGIADPTLPIYKVAAEESLLQERAKFEAGEKIALLGAIRICANHDMPLPDWAASAFIRGYDNVLACRSDSWDEVFGRPYKKGAHLSRMRQAREKRGAVWLKVNAAVQRDEPINRELFESIGREIGVGKTRAEELYAQAKRMLGSPAKK